MKQIINLKIVFVTILITRLFLFIVWNSAWFTPQKTDFWKHLYTGLIIIFISLFFKLKLKIILFSVGIALIIDEFIYIFHFLGLVNQSDYWSLKTISFIVVGFVLIVILSRFDKHNFIHLK